MHETSMHKHIGNELPDPKFFREKVVKTQYISKVNASALQQYSCKVHQKINDQQIFSNLGNAKSSWSEVGVTHILTIGNGVFTCSQYQNNFHLK